MSRTFLQQAVDLAITSVGEGGGPFGAVVVRDGTVVGRGHNRVVPARDPTAHAEVEAIRDACRQLGTHDLSSCELYSSCEPCPMCWGAVRWARLAAVRFGCSRRDAAEAGFDDELLHADFRRDPGEWSLPTEQREREAALEAFRVWHEKADRTPY